MKSAIMVLVTAMILNSRSSTILPNTYIIEKVQSIVSELNEDEQDKLKDFTNIGIDRLKQKKLYGTNKKIPKVIL